MDTTIKVDSQTRDRLAKLASERDTTIRDLVDQFSHETLTQGELDERARATEQYVRTHLCPDATDQEWEDAGEAAESVWQELAAGRVPESVSMSKRSGNAA